MRPFRQLPSLLAALLPLSALVALSASATSAPPRTVKAKGPLVSFRKDIEPFLRANCDSCHGSAQHSSGLIVGNVESLRKGGGRFGAKIIVPGKAAQSALIAYLRGTHQPRMPLNRPAIAEAQIQRIEAWINQGAKIDTVKIGFPYTLPVQPALPKVKSAAWVRTPVDRFILVKLEAKGLKPAPPASKTVLLRRVYTDLVGMPPTPEEAKRFMADTSPAAYESLIDRLLADARYGERWARHWLDLARYAETHGFEQDNIRPRAWRYRDYVIRSLNADKPYDRFLKEQIAGDELYPQDPDALIATGFARLGTWDELSTDHPQRWQDYLNDVTDTTGSVMLGMTIGCARCHDHKYDQITHKDYYQLQAFFVATKWVNKDLPGTIDPEPMRQKVADARGKIENLRKEQQTLREQWGPLALAEKEPANAKNNEKANDRDIEEFLKKPERKADREKWESLENQIRNLQRGIAPLEPVAETVTENAAKAPPQHLLLRGNLATPGPELQPGLITAMYKGSKPLAITAPADGKTTGRRSALAKWIASPDNPLTARVIANRLWQHHFGKGIVGTPSDFGLNGEQPTHPELLDYLAIRFVKEGWSLKKLHRLMLLSAAYRQSSAYSPTSAKKDPTNTLLWHWNRQRLAGEALRDSILTVSGRLNPEQGGPSVYPKVSDEVLSTGSTHKWGSSPEDQQRRRTVYVFQRRSLMLPIVEAFDGADMANTCPTRSSTTIAPQALALFNGEFSREEARFFAERVAGEAGPVLEKQIARAYQIALCRAPSPKEIVQAKNYLARKRRLYAAEKAAENNIAQRSLADFCHVLINTNEFIYVD